MAHSAHTLISRQVARARRRLFVQTMLTALVWAWLGALLVGAVWFLVQRPEEPFSVISWGVLGGLLGAGTVGALVYALWRRPSKVGAALSLDQRFGLKERVTTTLTLREDEVGSPAGQALLDDAQRQVAGLRVRERFPIRMPWTATLVPLAAGTLVLLAWLVPPRQNPVHGNPAEEPLEVPAVVKADINKKLEELKRKAAREEGEQDRLDSKELQKIEAELNKLAEKRPKTREIAREMVKEMTNLEQQIEQREKELAERVDALREQMKQAAEATRKEDDEDKKDGPARDLQRALQQANFQKAEEEAERLRKKMKAQEEAERLRKKLKDEPERLTKKQKQDIQDQVERLEKEGLNEQEQEQLAKQLENLDDQLQRLTRDQEEKLDQEEERLKKEKEEKKEKDELSQEEEERLDRELEQLQEQKANLEQLKEAGEKAGECKQCLKEGKNGEAAQKLEEMKGQMSKMQGRQEGERQQLLRRLQQLRQARRTLARALNNKAGQAWGKRPESKEGETGFREVKSPSEIDEGRLQITDFVPGQGFKGPRKPSEMASEIRQAAQAAPGAINRQRLPRSASDMARGYFEKLRESSKKPE